MTDFDVDEAIRVSQQPPHLMPAALDLYRASKRARRKLQVEYDRKVVWDTGQECWSEAELLDEAIEEFEGWLRKVDPRLPEAIMLHNKPFRLTQI